jgi:RNA polymerase sigma factor (sigma-70 family)
MNGNEWLAARFEDNRSHLRAVAYRMLGSTPEAEDAVQEAWLHVSRAGVDGVENLGGWLTTVVARICLDTLRSRKSRREDLHAEGVPRVDDVSRAEGVDPEQEAVLADSVGLALLVVLETLTPAERLAFVLHDLFAVPFEEIAPIVGRSPAAARQLASRARRRVQDADTSPDADPPRQRAVVDAFLAASRGGDFEKLLTLLDPEVVVRADAAAVRAGATDDVRGARDVAETFAGRAKAARLALLDGAPGAVWIHNGQVRIAFRFTVVHGRITGIQIVADPGTLRELDLDLSP